MNHVKTGAVIAFAAGALFASACEKKEDKPANQPAAKQPAPGPAKDADTKPEAGQVEPAKDPGAGAQVAPPAEPPAEKVSKVDCTGVNACKGQGTCKQEGHGCGGMNECKGKGVLTMTEEECKAKGGTVVATK